MSRPTGPLPPVPTGEWIDLDRLVDEVSKALARGERPALHVGCRRMIGSG